MATENWDKIKDKINGLSVRDCVKAGKALRAYLLDNSSASLGFDHQKPRDGQKAADYLKTKVRGFAYDAAVKSAGGNASTFRALPDATKSVHYLSVMGLIVAAEGATDEDAAATTGGQAAATDSALTSAASSGNVGGLDEDELALINLIRKRKESERQQTATFTEWDKVQTYITDAVDKALQDGANIRTIEVRNGDELMGRVSGKHHPMFAVLLKAAAARDVKGFAPNIWIGGPAGSGKTYAVEKVCEALGIGFECNGALSMPHELLGYEDAAGIYHSTAFSRSYSAPCGYCFDEVDGSDNAALLALNAALANGHATFPNGRVARHIDNRIFATANTWGLGATADFVGRAKLDAAFLSRFPVKVSIDYDESVEREICGNAQWAIHVQAARAKARAVGLKVMLTPRDSIGGAALIAAGFSFKEASELTYLASLSADQRKQMGA